MGGTREALIIATGTYADPELRRLRAPAQDAAPLARVLSDPSIGAFAVDPMIDQPVHVLARRIQQFFADRSLDDLLLLYISCHGIKDDDGRLHFAATDTERRWLASTGLSARFVNDLMSSCRARAIILLLDCCYSGAFMPGTKGDRGIHINDEFSGRGRAILTASSAIEYAWEGDDLLGEGQPSLFTGAVVHGLETGEADRDQDGVVSVEDLYKHVYERVREAKHQQTPLLSSVDIMADLYVARSPRKGKVQTGVLPSSLQQGMTHSMATRRAAAVVGLAQLLHGGDAGLRAASQQALELLSNDDSQVVSAAARAALRGAPPESLPERPPDRPPEPLPERPPEPPPEPERQTVRGPPALLARPRPGAAILARLRSHPVRSAAIAMALVALVVIGVALSSRLPQAPTAPVTQQPAVVVSVVTVPATQPWTDTRRDVVAGQRLRIVATGEIAHSPGGSLVGPNGDPRPDLQQYNVLPSAPHAALIGKVGDQGAPFLVGTTFSMVMDSNGRLFLGVNDVGVENNSGSFSARIELPPAPARGG